MESVQLQLGLWWVKGRPRWAKGCPYTGGPAPFHSEGLDGLGGRDGAGDGDGDEKDDKERAEPTPEMCGEESPAAAWAVGSDR